MKESIPAPVIRIVAPMRLHEISRSHLDKLLHMTGGKVTQSCFPKDISAEAPCVLFTPKAYSELCAVTHLGTMHPDNALECQYILEGYYFLIEHTHYVTVVTCVIPLQSAVREAAYTQRNTASDSTCTQLLAMQESFLERYSASHNVDLTTDLPLNPFVKEFGPPIQVGEGHTHPSLGVFWSTTDRSSVHARPGEPYINLVIDPHHPKLTPSRIEIMTPASSLPPKLPSAAVSNLDRFCDHLATVILCAGTLALIAIATALILLVAHGI